MAARVTAFFLWAIVAACAAFWVMRVTVSPRPVPGYAQPVAVATALRADVARLFAAPEPVAVTAGPTEPALASRFKLVGVMAPKSAASGSARGIALIAVDGKPPRPYKVGASLDTRLVLQTVAARSVGIGPAGGAVAAQLDLPPWTPAATGTIAVPQFAPVVQPPPGEVAEFPQMQQPAPSFQGQPPPGDVDQGFNSNNSR